MTEQEKLSIAYWAVKYYMEDNSLSEEATAQCEATLQYLEDEWNKTAGDKNTRPPPPPPWW
jgi:hypothetical protein